MKNDRAGEWLWEEWDGEGFYTHMDENIVYVTYDDVDLENDLVKRALASCLQRDGVTDTLFLAMQKVEGSRVVHGFAGFTEGEKYPSKTDEFGETEDGDETDYVTMATWVECPI